MFSRVAGNGSEDREDQVLLREDTAPFDEQEMEKKTGSLTSPADTVTCKSNCLSNSGFTSSSFVCHPSIVIEIHTLVPGA